MCFCISNTIIILRIGIYIYTYICIFVCLYIVLSFYFMLLLYYCLYLYMNVCKYIVYKIYIVYAIVTIVVIQCYFSVMENTIVCAEHIICKCIVVAQSHINLYIKITITVASLNVCAYLKFYICMFLLYFQP